MERQGVDTGDMGEEIHTGWTVVGITGERIGQVEDVYPDHLVVAKGFLFPSRWRVPVSAIARVESDWVQLNATRQQVEAQAWDERADDGTLTETVDDVAIDDESYVPRMTRSSLSADYSIDVPLSLDEVRVHRQRVGAPTDSEIPHTSDFTELVVDIPVRGEQAIVRTTPVVREVAVVSRRLRERNQKLTDTVRREELVIDGDVQLLHDAETRPFRT